MAIYPKRVNYILIECMMLLRKLRSSIRILVNSFRFYPFSQQWDGKCKFPLYHDDPYQKWDSWSNFEIFGQKWMK